MDSNKINQMDKNVTQNVWRLQVKRQTERRLLNNMQAYRAVMINIFWKTIWGNKFYSPLMARACVSVSLNVKMFAHRIESRPTQAVESAAYAPRRGI